MKILKVFVVVIVVCLAPRMSLAQKTFSWRIFGNLSEARLRFEVQPLSSDKLLVMGGRIPNNTTTNTCEIIDVKNDIVHKAPPMFNNRTDFPSLIDLPL